MTIGRFPTWSATAAREEARALRRKVDAKIDPLDEQEARLQVAEALRAAPTIRDLFERYVAEHLPRKAPRAALDDRSMWERLVLPKKPFVRPPRAAPSGCLANKSHHSK